jgi:uncharacterized membrane protein
MGQQARNPRGGQVQQFPASQKNFPIPGQRMGGRMGYGHGHHMMMGGGGRGMMMNAAMHEGMAAIHRQVAECLRSGESQAECMQVMRQQQQKLCAQSGRQNCQMMGLPAESDESGK